ncbi:Rpn family recombination-promoting nuclease/putative transposase [Virgibacillus sp. 179-BFC.A HS]|uniref:Rpn family recombination-promoting nuclease/putative transposase n=1 Tax=Tigheibacillus jepli TaxID=3035914 RepID=A0ABU5CJ49_9BACI|nr:Rpn family recombination-promoting nuclease/putative transposase [Virgibacillus sp. 179-BFC.A HS]MDY0406371.1 Rpn family recombination-promoting nuclease/putative transposase [Virgibacillus sp. 179-BFC.A HS]
MSHPQLVMEKSPAYPHHDQLFKELIRTFFEEFLEAFFPEIHPMIDFQNITFLSEEVFTDLLEGENRRLDIVVETKLKSVDAVVIVHVEPQSTQQTHFQERMYQYFSMLYQRHRKPIIPIAVFSYKENWEKNQFVMAFPFFHVLTFNYLTLHLHKKNWRDYITSDNPAAAALLSKMNVKQEERVQVKKEFLRMMVKMQLNPAKQRLIYGFFESYLQLNEEEEEQLMEEIKHMDEADKIMEIPISYEEKGKEIGKKIGEEIGKKMGKEEGIKLGREEGIRQVALEMLRKGAAVDFISEVTRLSKKEVEALKREL